jgi:hypothetical protein
LVVVVVVVLPQVAHKVETVEQQRSTLVVPAA